MTPFLHKIDRLFSSLGARFWTWFGIFGFFIYWGYLGQLDVEAWPNSKNLIGSNDPDIWLRLTKVHEFLQDGNIYNHDIKATNAPYGGITTPWTRPLDFILSGLSFLTPSQWSIEKRLLMVANWYPLIIDLLIIYVMTRAAEIRLKSIITFGTVILCLIGYGYNSQALNYFLLGNADHHSLQTLLWCSSIWMFLAKPSAQRSILLGLALGIWIWISPEALPFIFTYYVVLGIKGILDPEQSYVPLLTSLTVTTISLIATLIEIPPSQIFDKLYYDTISLVYVSFFAFCSVGFLALHLFISKLQNIRQRFISAGLLAVSLAGIFLSIFPKFIKGPMADVEPYILSHFLPRIWEATPTLKLDAGISLSILYFPILALILSLGFFRKHLLLISLLPTPLIMTFFEAKWSNYLVILSILIISNTLPPLAYLIRRKYKGALRFTHPYLYILAPSMIVALIISYFPNTLQNEKTKIVSACETVTLASIQSGHLVDTLGKEPLIIETNISGNSALPFFTPYRYVASFYHREGKNLEIQNKIFRAAEFKDALPLIKERQIQAILICPAPYPSWVNAYFEGQQPSIPSLGVNQNLTFPERLSAINPKPVLLMVNNP